MCGPSLGIAAELRCGNALSEGAVLCHLERSFDDREDYNQLSLTAQLCI
jgi:hypothetical protein